MKVITRFAPSPSGPLHMGGARTAFYSWLFARKHKGKFILRIEDSDKQRCNKKYLNNIIQSLIWLNIDWDEGPIYQSHRYERYNFIMNEFLKNNLAYKCYCSSERLIKLRALQIAIGIKPKYDKFCLFHKTTSTKTYYVVRFNTPYDGFISFKDLIRGTITFHNKELDDVIICRSDGNYTYNFCSVIDDLDMGITHIIRGEDHINNTPRQIHILQALKIKTLPKYAHLSMLLDSNKQKLSKRKKSINILFYKTEGFFYESILHYLFSLNNNIEEKPGLTLDFYKNKFNLNTNQRSAIIFNETKLLWCNKYFINNLQNNLLIYHFTSYLLNHNLSYKHKINFIKLINLLNTRCSTFKNMYNNFIYFYQDINVFNCIFLINKFNLLYILYVLPILYYTLLSLKHWSKENIHLNIKYFIHKYKFKDIDLYMFLRIIFTETTVSPPLFYIIEILGKEIILNRIHNVLLFKIQQNTHKSYNIKLFYETLII